MFCSLAVLSPHLGILFFGTFALSLPVVEVFFACRYLRRMMRADPTQIAKFGRLGRLSVHPTPAAILVQLKLVDDSF